MATVHIQRKVSGKDNPCLGLKYIRLVRMFLFALGAWPGELLGESRAVIVALRCLRKYMPVQTSLFLLGEIFFLYKYAGTNILNTSDWMINFSLTTLTVIRTSLPNFKGYGVVIKRFLTTFHLIHFKNKGQLYDKMYLFLERVSHMGTLYMMSMMIFGMMLYNFTPMYQNYNMGAFTNSLLENTTVEFSIPYAFPGFDPYDWFILATILNIYLSYDCASAVCSIDLLLSLIVFQIIGHVQILRNTLDALPKPKKKVKFEFTSISQKTSEAEVEMYDKEENELIHKKLVECIEHHKLIISFTDQVSGFFGPMLALNYLFHLVTCCLLLLECSHANLEALMRFGPLSLIIFGQLIQISVTFEVVGTVSEKLKDSVYFVPWECMDTRNRRSVCFFLNKVQDPITVKAMGLTDVGITTMAKILKTTFSFFTLLRTMEI